MTRHYQAKIEYDSATYSYYPFVLNGVSRIKESSWFRFHCIKSSIFTINNTSSLSMFFNVTRKQTNLFLRSLIKE